MSEKEEVVGRMNYTGLHLSYYFEIIIKQTRNISVLRVHFILSLLWDSKGIFIPLAGFGAETYY